MSRRLSFVAAVLTVPLAFTAPSSAAPVAPASSAATGALTVPALLPTPDVPRDDRALPSRRQMMDTVRDMVAIAPRKTGTPGGLKAARYVKKRFEQAGLDEVWMEKAVSYSWKSERYGLRSGGKKIDAFPISFSFIKDADPEWTGRRSLGRKGIVREVVDIGSAFDGDIDVRDKIVVFDLKFLTPLAALAPLMEFLHDPDGEFVSGTTLLNANPYLTSQTQTIDLLQKAGAAGVVGVLSDYFESNEYHNEYHRRSPMSLPGMWVTKSEGERLRRILRSGNGKIRMRQSITRRQAVARSPIGVLKGTTDETIMIQSHHDSMGPGAVEDGTGTAEVIALAEYYARLDRRPGTPEREKTLMFVTFDTHFTGYQSHMAFVEKYVEDPDSPYDIVVNDTIEHVAKKGVIRPDGSLGFTGETEPRAFFEFLSPLGKATLADVIVRNNLNATAILNANAFPVGIPTDASFTLAAGVPTMSLIAGPIYLYDEADTLRAVDRKEMRPILEANRDMIDWFEVTPSNLIGLVP